MSGGSTGGSVWDILGIAFTRDRAEIRRAYARRLRDTNPEDDPEGFKALRFAYETALHFVANGNPTPVMRRPDAPAKPVKTGETAIAPPLAAVAIPQAEPQEPPPAPPEPPPPDPRVIHAGLQGALDRLLRRKQPDPAAIVAAYNALMASPTMGMIDVESATEDWLAFVIATRAPKSDPLLPLAVKRFGWSKGRLRHRGNDMVQQVLRREKDLSFLRELRTDGTLHHKAWWILSQPFKPITLKWRFFSPTTPSMIADLIEVIRRDHPSVIGDLDRDTVARWEAWQNERPRLRTWGLWTAAAALPCLVLLLLGQMFLPAELRATSILLIIPPAFAAVALFNTVVLDASRRAWTHRRHGESSWLQFGWIPLLLATIALAAVPGLPFGVWLIAGLWLVGLIWVAITDGESEGTPLSRVFAVSHLFVWAGASTFALPAHSALQFTAAAGAGAIIPMFGKVTLGQLWLRLSRGGRIAAFAAAALFSLAALVLLGVSVEDDAWTQPAACAALAALVVNRNLAASFSAVEAGRLGWGALVAMVITAINGYAGLVLLVGGGGWLIWNLIRQVGLLTSELRTRGV